MELDKPFQLCHSASMEKDIREGLCAGKKSVLRSRTWFETVNFCTWKDAFEPSGVGSVIRSNLKDQWIFSVNMFAQKFLGNRSRSYRQLASDLIVKRTQHSLEKGKTLYDSIGRLG